jgi:serine/threonine protein kinase
MLASRDVPDERDKPAGDAGTLPAPDAAQAGTLPASGAEVVRQMPPDAGSGPFRIGAQVGERYQLRRFLGQGGMGAVFLAYDEMLGKEVALKTLRSEGVGSESQLRSLRDEVLLAQKVTHPNVCRTYDLSVVDRYQVVKMEYVAGESLMDCLRAKQRFSIDEAIATTKQIVAGLVAAHAQGVVHRDLKPQNILVERDTGRIVIMDFGLARIDARKVATASDGISGTPEYIAPEQAEGKPVDARADLYALGCVLYQLLVGTVPFTSDNRWEVLRKHITDPVPNPREARADLPPWLSALIVSLLQKQPDARPPNAEAVLHALDTPALQRKRRRRIGMSVALIATSLAIAELAPRKTTPSWQPKIHTLLPTYEENAGGPQLSPDGTKMAYDSSRDGTWRIYVGPMEGGSARAITPVGFEAQYPRWARDGASLLFRHGHDVYRVDLTGAAPVLVVHDAFSAVACDQRIAIAYTGSVDCPNCYRIALRGPDGEERELTKLPAGTWFNGPIACDPRVGVAYALAPQTFQGDQQPSDIWIVGLDGGAPRPITADHKQNAEPAFTADGASVIFSSTRAGPSNLWEIGVSGGAQQQITFGAGPDLSPHVSADGRALLYDNDVTSLPILARSLELHETRRITHAQVDVAQPLLHGNEVIAVLSRAGRDHVVGIPIDGGDERAIGDGSFVARGLTDDTLFVARSVDGAWRVERLPISGGAPAQVGALPAPPRSLTLAKDGLHFSINTPSGTEGWRMDPATGATQKESRYLVESPGARWRAEIRSVPDEGYVAEITALFSRPVVAPATLAFEVMSFTKDGRAIIYERGSEVRRYELMSRKDEKLFSHPDLVKQGLAVSDDEQTIYFVAAVGRVQRQIITNFAERKPLPKRATP